jgi:hypothetical protein
MKTGQSHTIQPKETPATIADVVLVKKALTTLLAEEASLMEAMQIGKVGELQDRKLKLTGLLERFMRYVVQHSELLVQLTPQEKRELAETSAEFQKTLHANHRALMAARAVNRSIVNCVTQLIAKKDNNPIYNQRGGAFKAYKTPVSLTLNQTI